MPYGQRPVVIGGGNKPLRHKKMPGQASHGLQHPGIPDASGDQLLAHHALTGYAVIHICKVHVVSVLCLVRPHSGRTPPKSVTRLVPLDGDIRMGLYSW